MILAQAGVHVQQQWEAIWPELATPDTPPAQCSDPPGKGFK